MTTAEQNCIIEFKHVSIGGISCFYGVSVASQLTLVEYSPILREQPVKKNQLKYADSLGIGNIH